MTKQRPDYDPNAYNPEFSRAFLAPKYWGTWLMLLAALPICLLVPARAKYRFAQWVARKLVKKKKGTILNAWLNLEACFPEQSKQAREAILVETLTTAGAFLLSFPLITLRGRQWFQQHCDVIGMEHITRHTDHGEPVILLVPHTWAIDAAAILFASQGLPVAAFSKRQKNGLLDWLMHRQRVQYGGNCYEREAGIKPFIRAVKRGFLGYYLPDEDMRDESSEFVPFFSTTKATLPSLGKLSKVTRSHIVPVLSGFDAKTGRFVITIHPAFSEFPTGDSKTDAHMMNQHIETMLEGQYDQYMWILQLLRTREDGRNIYQEAKRKRAS
ncbi:lauroyl-Kdo(2)-lipid IV(A) myristoyltransferase [Salinivibrio sp. EAGSL]|uniref:lauroyl-Kdo(2)-lipid IV(A) myristoyltransferase n=1 Tax=Salinivibrio sp. EAGSL TaxID=2738468 RepID=UPI00158A01CF|nr:lauroyl-Kdo(2)-lipid IV(A) myristoyltransferase [Salinivibrio sp. EAGSL]NUY55329.1 lauroyl-Kdo(2)-lipid IV(A) myristoyltransferase [Salinivibrio sp. EAGSL]